MNHWPLNWESNSRGQAKCSYSSYGVVLNILREWKSYLCYSGVGTASLSNFSDLYKPQPSQFQRDSPEFTCKSHIPKYPWQNTNVPLLAATLQRTLHMYTSCCVRCVVLHYLHYYCMMFHVNRSRRPDKSRTRHELDSLPTAVILFFLDPVRAPRIK